MASSFGCLWWFVWRVWFLIKLYIFSAMVLIKQMCSKHNKMPVNYDAHGLVAIVTGGDSGIGLQVSRILATKNNMHVVIACRNKGNAQKAIDGIKSEFSMARAQYMYLDLSSLDSVREFVEEFLNSDLPLHLLVNNAGVMFVPYSQTTDGYEHHFQVNYYSHLLLTHLLLPKLKESALNYQYSRIVNVSSAVHFLASYEDIKPRFSDERQYSAHAAYSASKLAQVMETYRLSRELKSSNAKVTVNALHPGAIDSNLYQHLHWTMKLIMEGLRKSTFKTTKQGAESVVYVALSPDLETVSGGYYDNCILTKSSSVSYSEELQDDLWKRFHPDL